MRLPASSLLHVSSINLRREHSRRKRCRLQSASPRLKFLGAPERGARRLLTASGSQAQPELQKPYYAPELPCDVPPYPPCLFLIEVKFAILDLLALCVPLFVLLRCLPPYIVALHHQIKPPMLLKPPSSKFVRNANSVLLSDS